MKVKEGIGSVGPLLDREVIQAFSRLRCQRLHSGSTPEITRLADRRPLLACPEQLLFALELGSFM